MIDYLVTGALGAAVALAGVSGGKTLPAPVSAALTPVKPAVPVASPVVTSTVLNPFTLTTVSATPAPTSTSPTQGNVAGGSLTQTSAVLATVMVSNKPPPRSPHKPPHPPHPGGDGDGDPKDK